MSMSKVDFEAMATALADAKRDAEFATDPGTPQRDAAMHALDMAARRIATACAGQKRPGGLPFNRPKFMDWAGFGDPRGN